MLTKPARGLARLRSRAVGTLPAVGWADQQGYTELQQVRARAVILIVQLRMPQDKEVEGFNQNKPAHSSRDNFMLVSMLQTELFAPQAHVSSSFCHSPLSFLFY